MPKDITFDWFRLDRDSLFGMLYQTSPQIVNQTLTVDQVHTRLVRQIRKHLPIRFKKNFNKKVEPGWVYVGGAYYSSYDEDFKKSIEVNFNYHSAKSKIMLTPRRFTRICLTFADTILHEIIHMRQHRRRGWKVLPDYPSTSSRQKRREEQKYLGCRDEIDAYAFNAACELNDKFSSHRIKIVNYLNQNHKGYTPRNSSYLMYLNAFGHDHNHPIIKKLKTKIVSYLPQAEIGKPFRTSDWIGY